METEPHNPILGMVDLSKLPSLDEKPDLMLGYLSDVNVYPVIKNFSHVLHWMYVNFSTTAEIQRMISQSSGADPTALRQLVNEIVEEKLSALSLTPSQLETVTTVTERMATIEDIQPPVEIVPGQVAPVTMGEVYAEVEAIRKALSGETT